MSIATAACPIAAACYRPAMLALAVHLALAAQSSLACPDCAPVRAARAAIAEDPQRWLYALAVAAPFLIAALVVAGLYRLPAHEEVDR